jgi:homocysteine S-methyltransferase
MSSSSALADRLAAGRPVIGDGGLGSLLSANVPRLRCAEEASLVAPAMVLDATLGFVAAGAELVTTNTFAANRRKLARLGLEDRHDELNRAAVRLAREARESAGRSVLVAGSMGPLAELGVFEEGDLEADFGAQALMLQASGVDAFLLETFFDPDELLSAIAAVRSISALPVVAMVSVDDDACTLSGVPVEDVAGRVAAAGVDVLGVNCSSGPHAVLEALARMRGCGLPLAAFPNVGLPTRVAGRISYPHGTPAYFADFARAAVSLGAVVVGGCCGTTAGHISAIRDALATASETGEPAQPAPRPRLRRPLGQGDAQPSALEQALGRGEWVVSLELDPPTSANPQAMLDLARRVVETGGAAWVDVNDTTKSRARIQSLVAAALIERSLGIETIPHLTPRDMTITGIESLLLGAHAEGIRNLLVVTGDPPTTAGRPDRAGVYEVDSLGLCRLVTQLNRGEDWNGRPTGEPTRFHLGVAVNPTADDLELEVERFRAKVAAGARFAMTQSLFSLEPLERFRALLGGSWPIPLLVGVFHVTSLRMALHLHNEVPGIVVQEDVRRLFADAGAGSEQAGIELAERLIREAAGLAGVAGVYVIPPFRNPEVSLPLFERLGRDRPGGGAARGASRRPTA